MAIRYLDEQQPKSTIRYLDEPVPEEDGFLTRLGRGAVTGIGKGARALGQGALGVVDIAALPIQAGMQQLGFNPQLPSEFFTQRVDVATGGALKPANMVERFGEQLGQFVGGAGATNTLAQGTKYAAPLMTKTMKPTIGAAIGSQAAEEADLGAVGEVAGGVLGAMAGGARLPRKAPTPQYMPDEVKAMARAKYAEAEKLGGIFKPSVTDKFIDEVNKLTPQTKEGQLIKGKNEFTQIVQRINSLRGRPLSLQAIDEIDDELANMVKMEGFSVSKPSQKILEVKDKLRNVLAQATENDVLGGKSGYQAVKEADKLWGAAAKLRDIENILAKAETMDKPATAIKTGFRNLAFNAKKNKFYTPEERKLLEKAATSGMGIEILRFLSSRLIGQIAGATGGLAAGAGGFVLGEAARAGATAGQAARAGAVAREVTKNISPKELGKLPAKEAAAILNAIQQGTK